MHTSELQLGLYSIAELKGYGKKLVSVSEA